MENESNLTFYIDDLWMSPYTYSVFCALREKNISFKLHEVHFEKSQAMDLEFKGKTFTDLIPAIKHNGAFISESLAILEYLEEVMPLRPSIYPKDSLDKARARGLLSWYRCGFTALRNERSMETVFFENCRQHRHLSSAALEEVYEFKEALNTYLKPGKTYLFNNWSIADSETALMLNRLIANGDPLEEKLVVYAKNILSRPANSEFIERKRKPYVSYYG